ncbi:MAG TPA: VWA domain-containing protein, partial [Gammaproteobacteria bacterium]|nr:VWA domain-containing protein [Gammaproteobacteria bacterium]
MSIDLADYREQLAEASPEVQETFEATFHEAARVMSPAGLRAYLEGGKGLCQLGRGSDLVISYLEEMPLVVKECGEDVIGDCVHAAMKLSSMTSGEVITLLFSSLPTAARRLGDPELLKGYLTLIHQLSARASRGLRPMLRNIDELLTKLTLSGLKRWANFGAEAYKRDLQQLQSYFALETADSRKVLQQERRGTLFIDSQRKLNFYLRALWGRDFFMRPAAADYEGFKPYVEDHVIHLPDAVDPIGGISGMELYRAQAAHMGAHIQYTREAISAEQLSPAQMFFIGVAEDARVEYNAVQEFPGLFKLWRSLLTVEHAEPAGHPTIEAVEHFALMLLDPTVQSDDDALNELAGRFHRQVPEQALDGTFSWHLGIELFNLFATRQAVPSLRVLESIRLPYRDDNRFVWEFEEFDWSKHGTEYIPASQRQVRKYVSAVEMANEVDCELAGDDAQEVWICPTEFFPYEDAREAQASYNEMWGKEPVSEPFHYQEWDYQVQLFRPDWATVYEHRPAKADPDAIAAILTEYKPVASRIKQIIDLLSPE